MSYIKLIAHIYALVCWGDFVFNSNNSKTSWVRSYYKKPRGRNWRTAREKIKKVPKDMRPETTRHSLKLRK